MVHHLFWIRISHGHGLVGFGADSHLIRQSIQLPKSIPNFISFF